MGPLKQRAKVYLDTNILIYLTEGTPAQKAAMKDLFAMFEAAEAEFITSELAYTEVLVLPLRQQDGDLILAYEHLFDHFVEALPVSRDALYLAAKLRAETPSQKTPDAIHVATATLAQADAFVTGDAGIRNIPPSMRLHRV